jgi:hypothetical protein
MQNRTDAKKAFDYDLYVSGLVWARLEVVKTESEEPLLKGKA